MCSTIICSIIYYIFVCIYIYVCHGTHVEVRGQPTGLYFFYHVNVRDGCQG